MPALTPREAVVELVERSAAHTGKKEWFLWDELFYAFEHQINMALTRIAHNTCVTRMDLVEADNLMGQLHSFALGFLKLPALPDKEKGPLQGSLID